MLNHMYFPGQWKFSTFLCDVLRFLFLPVSAALIVAILVYVVALDLVVWVLWLMLSMFYVILIPVFWLFSCFF